MSLTDSRSELPNHPLQDALRRAGAQEPCACSREPSIGSCAKSASHCRCNRSTFCHGLAFGVGAAARTERKQIVDHGVMPTVWALERADGRLLDIGRQVARRPTWVAMCRPFEPHAAAPLWAGRLSTRPVADYLVGRGTSELQWRCLASLFLLRGDEALVIRDQATHGTGQPVRLRIRPH